MKNKVILTILAAEIDMWWIPWLLIILVSTVCVGLIILIVTGPDGGRRGAGSGDEPTSGVVGRVKTRLDRIVEAVKAVRKKD